MKKAIYFLIFVGMPIALAFTVIVLIQKPAPYSEKMLLGIGMDSRELHDRVEIPVDSPLSTNLNAIRKALTSVKTTEGGEGEFVNEADILFYSPFTIAWKKIVLKKNTQINFNAFQLPDLRNYPQENPVRFEDIQGLDYLLMSGYYLFAPPHDLRIEKEIDSPPSLYHLPLLLYPSSRAENLFDTFPLQQRQPFETNSLGRHKYEWLDDAKPFFEIVHNDKLNGQRNLLLTTDIKVGANAYPERAARILDGLFNYDVAVQMIIKDDSSEGDSPEKDFFENRIGSNSTGRQRMEIKDDDEQFEKILQSLRDSTDDLSEIEERFYSLNIFPFTAKTEIRNQYSRAGWRVSLVSLLQIEMNNLRLRRFVKKMNLGEKNFESFLQNEDNTIGWNYLGPEKTLIARSMDTSDLDKLSSSIYDNSFQQKWRNLFSEYPFINKLVSFPVDFLFLGNEAELTTTFVQVNSLYDFYSSPSIKVVEPIDWKKQIQNIYLSPHFLNEISDMANWDYQLQIDQAEFDAFYNDHQRYYPNGKPVSNTFAAPSLTDKALVIDEAYNKMVYSRKAPLVSQPLYYDIFFDNIQKAQRAGLGFSMQLIKKNFKAFFSNKKFTEDAIQLSPARFFLSSPRISNPPTNNEDLHLHNINTWVQYRQSYEKTMSNEPNKISTERTLDKNEFTENYLANLDSKINRYGLNLLSATDGGKNTDIDINTNRYLLHLEKSLRNSIVHMIIIFGIVLILFFAIIYMFRKWMDRAGSASTQQFRWIQIADNRYTRFFLLIFMVPFLYHVMVKPALQATHDIAVIRDFRTSILSTPGNAAGYEQVTQDYLNDLLRTEVKDNDSEDNYFIKLLIVLLFAILLLMDTWKKTGRCDVCSHSYLDWLRIAVNFALLFAVFLFVSKKTPLDRLVDSVHGFSSSGLNDISLKIGLPVAITLQLITIYYRVSNVNRLQRQILMENHYAPREIIRIRRLFYAISTFWGQAILITVLFLYISYVKPPEASTEKGFYTLLTSDKQAMIIVIIGVTLILQFYLTDLGKKTMKTTENFAIRNKKEEKPS